MKSSCSDRFTTVAMEPVDSNGDQMLVQVSPIAPKQLRYSNMRQDVPSILIALGSIQLGIGVICIPLNIVLLTSPKAISVFEFVGHGIWSGVFLIVTGAFGIVGGIRPTKCYILTFFVLSILACFFAAALIAVGAVSAIFTVVYLNLGLIGIVLESLLAILGLASMIVSIVSTIVSCCDCNGCCCCPPSTDSVQAEHIIDPATSGQHTVSVSNSGQRFNSNSSVSASNSGQEFNHNNQVSLLNSGYGFNSNNQLQQMASSNQHPMCQCNAPLHH